MAEVGTEAVPDNARLEVANDTRASEVPSVRTLVIGALALNTVALRTVKVLLAVSPEVTVRIGFRSSSGCGHIEAYTACIYTCQGGPRFRSSYGSGSIVAGSLRTLRIVECPFRKVLVMLVQAFQNQIHLTLQTPRALLAKGAGVCAIFGVTEPNMW